MEDAITDLESAGSSPHTWGTRDAGLNPRGVTRFIPTHVGNTVNSTISAPPLPVHPHTRGEHLKSMTLHYQILGSSPHTWGTREIAHRHELVQRFIPTHVGNTRYALSKAPIATVHPHTRGEHGRCLVTASSMSGSSPHTWGTRCGERCHSVFLRFIPTHVGNTLRCPGPLDS